ncbi:adenosine deaminase family protein, partial [Streptomyces sp. DT225]
MRMLKYLRGQYPGAHLTLHAGELAPGLVKPEDLTFHINEAVRVAGAERIGHGTSSVADPKLLDHLAERRIALEVCPTSNIATRAVKDIEQHPVREMVRAGVLVTINSDDPPMFGTDLN